MQGNRYKIKQTETQLRDKSNGMRSNLISTLVVIVVLVLSMLGIIGYMYKHSENESSERLRMETVRIKNSIDIQISSDIATLRTMAALIPKRYSDAETYVDVCKKFRPFGICENIGILLPDNTLVTKHGITNVDHALDFKTESARGEYTSGRLSDLTNGEKELVRSAVPVKNSDGKTVAIIYGTINIDKLTDQLKKQAGTIGAYISIIEGENGMFVANTKPQSPENISALASIAYKDGYGYSNFIVDMTEGRSGYTAFLSREGDDYLYAYYCPLAVSDWRLMLAQPESAVFNGARVTAEFLIYVSALIILIMLLYITSILLSFRKMLKINSTAAEIRKSLLEIYQRRESLSDALEQLTTFAKSRSAFVIDSYGEEHHYIRPEDMDLCLNREEIKYFNDELLLYTAKHRTVHSAEVYLSAIQTNKELRAEMPDLYVFMKEHGIESVQYATVISSRNNLYILGVLNPKNNMVTELLGKIAVCFCMSVYNQKHLRRTEKLALTDSLTGLANRMAFSQDLKNKVFVSEELSCIYLDVNELHFYNNKHGHAAGDQMLKFVAKSLTTQFRNSNIYRMGGDEFLVLTAGMSLDEINERLRLASEDIEAMKYHVAIGLTRGSAQTSVEEIVNEAERIMYDNKARYYQDKQLGKVKQLTKDDAVIFETGISEIDACLSIMTLRYMAVYCVSLEKDSCTKILAPKYFREVADETNKFSVSIRRYIGEFVSPEYSRAMLAMLEYDTVKKQLKNGDIPRIDYERIDGKKIVLRIYPINQHEDDFDSVWVFEKQY